MSCGRLWLTTFSSGFGIFQNCRVFGTSMGELKESVQNILGVINDKAAKCVGLVRAAGMLFSACN